MKAKKARVFWAGRSQAIRLPKEFRFATDTVLVHREGRAVVLEPADEWPEGYVEVFCRGARRLQEAATGPGREEELARMKFLLDTDTCIYALKQNPTVLKHLLTQSREDIAVSVITEAELRTGAAKSTPAAKTLRLVENFLRPLGIIEFTSSDAASYAQVRANLERAGTPIGPLDTLIAAQAVARKLVLVSNNEREFSRVAGLRIENWGS